MRIFISYSKSDAPFIQKFSGLLSRALPDCDIWFDDKLEPGKDWWESIQAEISQCDVFICLLSNDFLESEYCQKELRLAFELRKDLLPVLTRSKLDPTKAPRDLQVIVQRTQWIDMSSGASDAQGLSLIYGKLSKQKVPANGRMLPPTIESKVVTPESLPQTSVTVKNVVAETFGSENPLYFSEGVEDRPRTLEQLWKQIYQSRLCVFDLTAATSTTYVELGIAIALNRHIIVISEHDTQVPATLTNYVLRYSDADDLRAQLDEIKKSQRLFRTAVKEYCHTCNQLCPNMDLNADENIYFVLNNSRAIWKNLYDNVARHLQQSHHLFPQYMTDSVRSTEMCNLRQKVLSSQFLIFHGGSATNEESFLILGIAIGSLRPWLLLQDPAHNHLPNEVVPWSLATPAALTQTDWDSIASALRSVTVTIPGLQQYSPNEPGKADDDTQTRTSTLNVDAFWLQMDDWVRSFTQKPRGEIILGTLRVIRYKQNLYLQKYYLHPTHGLAFGKDSDRCDVQLDNDLASKEHFRVYGEGGRYFVEDLGSTNGTFLNGKKLKPRKKVELFLRDTIRVPGAYFLIWDERDLPNRSTPSPGETGIISLKPSISIEFEDVPSPFEYWDHLITLRALLPDASKYVDFETQTYYPLGRVVEALVSVLQLPHEKYYFEYKEQIVDDNETPSSLQLGLGDKLQIIARKQ